MALQKTVTAKLDAEQHSLTRSVILHLLPGVVLLTFYALSAPFFINRGYPALLALNLSILVVLVPLELGLLLYEGRKRNSRLSLAGVVLFRERVPLWQAVILAAVAFVCSGLCFTLVAPLADAWLLKTFFSWVPEWFIAKDLVQNLAPYSRSALAITGVATFVLGSIVGPVVEELYFRGYLLPRLSRLGGWAPLLDVLLFSLYHLFTPWENITRILALVPMVYVVFWKKNIYLGIVAHVLLNVVGSLGLLMLVFR